MFWRAACSQVSFETEEIDEGEPNPVFFEKVLTELIKLTAATLKKLFIATSSYVPSDVLSQLSSFS